MLKIFFAGYTFNVETSNNNVQTSLQYPPELIQYDPNQHLRHQPQPPLEYGHDSEANSGNIFFSVSSDLSGKHGGSEQLAGYSVDNAAVVTKKPNIEIEDYTQETEESKVGSSKRQGQLCSYQGKGKYK